MSDFPGSRQTVDDRAFDHLRGGATMPRVALPATTGGTLDVVADVEWTVVFLYPATGVPGEPLPDGWLELPGAYGCTAETCRFRDLVGEFKALGTVLRGISTQTPKVQAEFAAREGVTYPLLSDEEHRLVDALRLPTFTMGGSPQRLRRATLLVTRDRMIRTVLYPVPDPARHADEVLDWLKA